MYFVAFSILVVLQRFIFAQICINQNRNYQYCNFVNTNHTAVSDNGNVIIFHCNFSDYTSRLFGENFEQQEVTVNIEFSNFFNFSVSHAPLGIHRNTPDCIYIISFIKFIYFFITYKNIVLFVILM
jgi:hypothetical protein